MHGWTSLDAWIVVTGALIGMACALPGVFLVLGRQSLLGDAIGHGVLPGLAAAFLITGSRDWPAMITGAALAGICTAVLSQWVHRVGRVESGAAMGVVFCSLFALGLVLVRLAADRVDLDPGCVLYGSLETAVIDTSWIPRAAVAAAVMLVLNALLVWIFYKELVLVTFDPTLATTLGRRAGWITQGVAVMTAVTAVVAFESVGSILVVTMLVVPAATARLLSHRLPVILWLSLALAALDSLLGHWSAVDLAPKLARALFRQPGLGATSSAAMMAVVAGVIFAGVLIGSFLATRRVRLRPPAPASAPQA